jgi:hypothetical protein
MTPATATTSCLPAPLPAVELEADAADAVPDAGAELVPDAALAVATICPFDVITIAPLELLVIPLVNVALLGVCVPWATSHAALPVTDGV